MDETFLLILFGASAFTSVGLLLLLMYVIHTFVRAGREEILH